MKKSVPFAVLAAAFIANAPTPLFAQTAFFIPAESDGDLIQAPVIEAVDGVLSASVDMIRAGAPGSGESILYGNRPLYSSTNTPPAIGPGGGLPPPWPPYYPANFAAAYKYTYKLSDGTVTNLPAQFPGATLKLERGDTLKLEVSNRLAEPNTAPALPERLLANFHTHGGLVSPLGLSDNVYRTMVPGGTYQTSVRVPAFQTSGVGWYHVHRHGFSADQVYAGLAGMMQIGDPLDPWPAYRGKYEQKIMALTVGLKAERPGGLMLTDPRVQRGVGVYGTDYQVYVNGQYNPTTTMKPGETQIWTVAATVRNGSFNFGITDAQGNNPWKSFILSYDGNDQGLLPLDYTQVLPTNYVKNGPMALDPGARITFAVTAPTTPGTYYLVDNISLGQVAVDPFSIMTIVVTGDPATEPAPVFGASGPVPYVYAATPDHERTFEFTRDATGPEGSTAFKINGYVFPEGPMVPLQSGQIERWTLVNPSTIDHPFHIHQLDFAVVSINGVLVDTSGGGEYPYISLRDTVNIPAQKGGVPGEVVIKFRVTPFDGKYVFHCHILPHEDGGMMTGVISGPNPDQRRVALGATARRESGVIVQNGDEAQVSWLDPLSWRWKGAVVTATGNIAGDQTQEIVAGVGTRAYRGYGGLVFVYDGTTFQQTGQFQAFPEDSRAGVSLAVGDIDHDGKGEIIVGRVGPGPSLVRIFRANGTLYRELSGLLPGNFPNGVNVAVADFNGDNFDDLAIGGGLRSEPRVIGLDGFYLGKPGAAEIVELFDFVAPGGNRSGVHLAAGYADESTVPSYSANLVTTPASGRYAGTVYVWNVATTMDHSASSMDSMSAEMEMPPALMSSFQPYGKRTPALQIAVGRLGSDGHPMVISWDTQLNPVYTCCCCLGEDPHDQDDHVDGHAH
ncbi:MAG: multicopper oxidase domain-containing protein [Chthoniobacterales bacterium]|nr:multicopper oxidase domain-containing protein [Chthoniobacterales bacterium]